MRRHLIAVVTVVTAFAAALGPATPAVAAPPVNDDFSGAQQIAGRQGSLDVSFQEATSDPRDPAETYGEPSLWFRWTAPSSGWYAFRLPDTDEDCFGVTAVYQGDSADSLVRRSHEVVFIDWWSRAAFVRAVEGQSYAIAASSSCTSSFYDSITFEWEPDAPLIVTVVGPNGAPEPDVVVAPGMEDWDKYYADLTDADGRAYFDLPAGAYGSTLGFELDPWSVNHAIRYVEFTTPPKPTSRPIIVKKVLPAKPSVDLDRDGLGDVVSGVPLADRGAVNAGAVVVQFGDGRRRVVDEASAGVPSDRARAEQFGAAVSTADVDDDGWPDLTVGAPGELVGTVRSGAVFIVFGSARGLGNGKRTLRMHQGQAAVAGGGRAGDRFGGALNVFRTYPSAHFIVGVPGKDSGGQADAGAVVRFTKFPTRARYQLPSRVWHQGTPGVGGNNVAGDRFGSALASGGFASEDFSLAIGVPGKDAADAPNAGAIVVLRGTDALGRYAESGNPMINQNVTSVVPGAKASTGNAFGSSLAVLREQLPTSPWQPLHASGRHRLAVGAPGDGGGSVTLLTSGKDQPLVFAPATENTRLVQGTGNVPGANEAGDRFGAALAVGDVNDDREYDLVVGAPGEEVSGRAAAGTVTLLHGARDAIRPRRWVAASGVGIRPGLGGVPGGPSAGGRFGQSVASLDVNGDGHPDVGGGKPGDDTVARNAGAVYMAHGSPSGLRGGRRVTWPEARRNDNFGARLAAPRHPFF